MAEQAQRLLDGVSNNNNNNNSMSSLKMADSASARRSRTLEGERQPSLVYDSTVRAPAPKQDRSSPVRTHASIASEERKQTQTLWREGAPAAAEKPLINDAKSNNNQPMQHSNTPVVKVTDTSQSGLEFSENLTFGLAHSVHVSTIPILTEPDVIPSLVVNVHSNTDKDTVQNDVGKTCSNDSSTAAPSSPPENSKVKEGIILSSEDLINKLDIGDVTSKPRSSSLPITFVESNNGTSNGSETIEQSESSVKPQSKPTADNTESIVNYENKETIVTQDLQNGLEKEKSTPAPTKFYGGDSEKNEKPDAPSGGSGTADSRAATVKDGDTMPEPDASKSKSSLAPDDAADTSNVEYRAHVKNRGELRHAMSEVLPNELQSRRRSQTMANVKEHAYGRLQEELSKAQEELKLKDEEVEKLLKVRDQMGEELEELTASLFEEANNMVQDANIKRMHAEKLHKEAAQQIEVLQAEVVALKQLVLTSTPSSPNKHLHPQIDTPKSAENGKKEKPKSTKPFWKTHRRSTSHHEFTKEARQEVVFQQEVKTERSKEVDTVAYEEFVEWRQSPSLDKATPFLSRIYVEDIGPCLNFSNVALAERLKGCVADNTLTIEPIHGNNSTERNCRLTDVTKLCNFKIKLGEDQEWYHISQLCRNRIAAVCDFYTYLRYIHQGLVKGEDTDVYQEIVRLRKQISLARLGFS